MKPMHRLLRRQLDRFFGDPESVPAELQGFITAVDDAYKQSDGDREMLERSLELSSQELLQANSDMRAVFQVIPDLFFRLDGEGTIIDYKAGGKTDFYAPPKSLLGKRIQDIPVRQVAAQFDQAICQVKLTKSQVSIEYSLQIQHRRVFYEARLLPLNENEIITIIRDITERKQAEEELRSFAAKLAWSNRELEEFASVASHDLQEPLRKVRAFGDRLKALCGEGLPETGRDYLERMQSAAVRMQTLIEDLLTFSRVTTKAKPFVAIELEQVAREVLSDLEVTIGQLGGRVELGKLPVIEADQLQIRQMLQNLISNGLKFHKESEAPVVKIHCELDKEQSGSYSTSSDDRSFQLVVEDNGIGFDEKYREKIFGIFQRLHGRGEFEGTGIGLAVCRKIAERHGGDITARSTPGQGAKFIVTLPLRQHQGGEHEEYTRKTDYDLVGRG